MSALVFRYFILVVLSFSNLYIFYKIFTPLTVYPVFWILKSLYGAQFLEGNIIFIKGYYAEVIAACVAGAAYYLLLILNLTTPMHLGKRVKNLLAIFFSFLILNVIRILIFIILLFNGYQYFDITHELVWYFGSTLMVVLIWFTNIWFFNINGVPIYTDMLMIFEDITSKKIRDNKPNNRENMKKMRSSIQLMIRDIEQNKKDRLGKLKKGVENKKTELLKKRKNT